MKVKNESSKAAPKLKPCPIDCEKTPLWCEKCKRRLLKDSDVVWLPAYGGKQGLFPFGKDCAKKEAQNDK